MSVQHTWFDRVCDGVFGLVLAASWLASGPAYAQSVQPLNATESQVKAAYVYRFTQYVEWPADAFARSDSPLVIGVIGADAIADELEVVVKGKAIDQHRVQVRRLDIDADAGAAALHVLVVGALDRPTWERTRARVRGKPVLVVSSERLPETSGAMINFVVLEQRVRFEVALAPVSQARMRLSSQMLSVAHRVIRAEANGR